MSGSSLVQGKHMRQNVLLLEREEGGKGHVEKKWCSQGCPDYHRQSTEPNPEGVLWDAAQGPFL